MTNKYLGVVTGKQFQDQYNEMEQKGMNPKASTVIPIKDSEADESRALFHVWIFYGPVQKKQPIKMEL